MKRPPAWPGIRSLLFAVLIGAAFAPRSTSAAVPPQLRVDPASVPTGILYDLATPMSRIERFDGTPSASAATAADLRQAAFELSRGSLEPRTWPDPQTMRDDGATAIRIALLDVRYDRVLPGAIDDGRARREGDRLVLDPGAVATKRAFMAAPLRGYTYRGADVTFVLDPRLLVAGGPRPAAVEVDFDDGAGFRPIRGDELVRAHYGTTGTRAVRVRALDENAAILEANFAFDVRSLVAPLPNDTIPLAGTIPYAGGVATGRAFVYLSASNPVLARPVVVVEGFDLDNTMNWDELYALLNQENLIETIRARGYDAVVLDFTEATDYIQRNAFLAVELLEEVQAMIAPDQPVVMVGASMGGLVSRYALAWMEQNGVPHHVRNFVSIDAPHKGANIPLGIQYWLDFFSSESADAAHLLSRLDTPAAKELLLYHHTTPVGSAGVPDPLRATFTGELAALGDYPVLPRRVALANGSGMMANQGFAAGAQIIQYAYSLIFIANIRGHVWAVPNGGPLKIFDGLIQVIFQTTRSLVVNVSGVLPWDNAPGGSRDSMAQMDAVAAPYGDIIALYPSHCFIPTISALDVATADPFYNVDGDPDLLQHTPFQAVYYPAVNEPHVTVNPQSAAWLLDEVDPPATAVRPGASPPGLSHVVAAPNPFDRETAVRWELSRASRVRVDVFDVQGRRVASLADGTRPSGPGEAHWNGRDARGREVASGVYFVRVQAAGQMLSRRVLRLR